MALTLYAPCTETLPANVPTGQCADEGSGILGLLLVKNDFDLTTITDSTTYGTAKTAKNLIVVKDIEAYWPKASRQTIPGIAGRMARHGRWEYEIPFKQEGVDANLLFWNNITQSRQYSIVWITEEYKAFTPLDRLGQGVTCDISAAPAADQEFGKVRYIEGSIKWKYKDLYYALDTAVWTPTLLKADFDIN